VTAEGIRPAFYFGVALGRELRAVHEGRITRDAALARYGAFNDAHRWKYEWMLRVQRLVPRVPPRLLAQLLRGLSVKQAVTWSFNHYMEICPPEILDRPLVESALNRPATELVSAG
jgi:flavin-dependent dehydrogenase